MNVFRILSLWLVLIIPSGLSAQMTEAKARERLSQGYGFTLTGNLFITAPLEYNHLAKTRSQIAVINLNGWAIVDGSQNGLPVLIGRTAPDQTTALNKMQDFRLIIRDGKLEGKAGTGTLLKLDASYTSIIQGVTFVGGKISLDAQFCLNGHLSDCNFNSPDSVAINVNRGRWPGAGVVNAQSNHFKIEQCRVYNRNDAFAAVSIWAASGVEIDGLISEGRVPKYHIYFDTENASVVKDFRAKRLHFESTPDLQTDRRMKLLNNGRILYLVQPIPDES